VISRIDYCNCLLVGAPQYQLNRLQAVMNSAGRLICGLREFDHISQVLHDRLHWLAVPQRIRYKLCLLVYKALHGLIPQYLTDFCQLVSLVSSRSGLRSSTQGRMTSSSSQHQQTLGNDPLLCPLQQHGTNCHQTSGICSR